MNDRFEATFVVNVPARDAWEAFVREEGSDPAHWWLPGFEATGEEIEVDPGRLLRVRKDTFPCEGTEIAVVLESAETGTKVTLVQSGFGAIFNEMLEALEVGWSHIVADLAIYLERGVRLQRHLRPWATLGCELRSTAAGLEIGAVIPETFADRVGLTSGDILVSVGDAPVVTRRELETLMRVFRAREKVEATVVRGRELVSESGVL